MCENNHKLRKGVSGVGSVVVLEKYRVEELEGKRVFPFLELACGVSGVPSGGDLAVLESWERDFRRKGVAFFVVQQHGRGGKEEVVLWKGVVVEDGGTASRMFGWEMVGGKAKEGR